MRGLNGPEKQFQSVKVRGESSCTLKYRRSCFSGDRETVRYKRYAVVGQKIYVYWRLMDKKTDEDDFQMLIGCAREIRT